MSITLEKIKIEVTCRCSHCGNSFTQEVDPQNLESYTLRRCFEDTDDGFVLNTYIRCPYCKSSSEVELTRKKGWGM
jgi:uncharacterized Zn finger protein